LNVLVLPMAHTRCGGPRIGKKAASAVPGVGFT